MPRYLGQTGAKNGAWKGGRTVASNGYVLVRVGTTHHLADCRGYAYEHRVMAEKKIGRRLKPGELVHHIDHNKKNNAMSNLQVCATQAHHRLAHRKQSTKVLRLPGEPNPGINCACGCGSRFKRYDSSGRPRIYISGHNPPRFNEHREAAIKALQEGPIASRALARRIGTSTEHATAIINRLGKRGIAARAFGKLWALKDPGAAQKLLRSGQEQTPAETDPIEKLARRAIIRLRDEPAYLVMLEALKTAHSMGQEAARG